MQYRCIHCPKTFTIVIKSLVIDVYIGNKEKMSEDNVASGYLNLSVVRYIFTRGTILI